MDLFRSKGKCHRDGRLFPAEGRVELDLGISGQERIVYEDRDEFAERGTEEHVRRIVFATLDAGPRGAGGNHPE